MPLKARNMIPEDDMRVAQIGHPAPPWLINYADLMTEMVCFFIILYALSAALNKDMQKAQQEIQEMIKQGAVSVIKKPFKMGEIASVIRDAIAPPPLLSPDRGTVRE